MPGPTIVPPCSLPPPPSADVRRRSISPQFDVGPAWPPDEVVEWFLTSPVVPMAFLLLMLWMAGGLGMTAVVVLVLT
ncbi:MAG: hypothetical protein AAGA48_24425 [Myxococcota bacterium]